MIKLYVDATKKSNRVHRIGRHKDDMRRARQCDPWDKTPVEGIFLSRKVEYHE